MNFKSYNFLILENISVGSLEEIEDKINRSSLLLYIGNSELWNKAVSIPFCKDISLD